MLPALLVLLLLLSPGVGARAAMPVLITVDTETSSGCRGDGCFPSPLAGRIYGEFEGRQYGIPLIMDLLEQHGMRGTFFVNPHMDAWYPEAEVEAMVRSIVDRGHDVQLHPHPEFRCFRRCKPAELQCRFLCTRAEGRLAGASLENQVTILREGAESLARWSGRYPVAFRGPALLADENTLKALARVGIPVDSSVAGPQHPLASVLPVNQLGVHGGILEIPLLAYEEDLLVRRRVRFLDQESSTLAEQVSLLEQAGSRGVGAVPLLMHSFSFCDPANACPVPANIERFEALLSYLASRPDRFRVETMAGFWSLYQQEPSAYTRPVAAGLPRVSYWLVLRRSVERFNHGWMNVAFLLGNLAAALVVLAGLAWAALRFARRRPA